LDCLPAAVYGSVVHWIGPFPYRQNNGFDHLEVALSIGVQRMVGESDPWPLAGVIFTLEH